MAYAIGIDLGTTNSVASVYQRGVAETLSVEGRSYLPSVVSFREDGALLVGQPAKSRMLIDPENTVFSSKRYMGDRGKTYSAGKKTLTPVNVASIILKQLAENAQRIFGEAIWDAVITVPAYFNELQKEDTKKAGEEAGLNVLRLIPEPTAAAIAYGMDKEKNQTIMVYDLGGGTFDVSILEVKGNTFNVKAVGGDSRLGGDDFDDAVIFWVNDQFKNKTGIDILTEPSREGKMARQRLKEAVETAKIELSQSETAFIDLPDCMGRPLSLELKLPDYNRLIEPYLKRTIDCMNAVFKDARMTPRDIDRVILVGGSTKNKRVRDIVAEYVKEPYIADRVDEVVSHGAAIVAASLFLPTEDLLPIEISDVTAHSLGVDLLDRNNKLIFKPIIPRQSGIPHRNGILAYTSSPMQDLVDLRVFRGEDVDPEKNTYLGELHLDIIHPQQIQLPVAVIFDMDVNGIIEFTALEIPIITETQKLLEYAQHNEGALLFPDIDKLIRSGKTFPKTVQIDTNR